MLVSIRGSIVDVDTQRVQPTTPEDGGVGGARWLALPGPRAEVGWMEFCGEAAHTFVFTIHGTKTSILPY